MLVFDERGSATALVTFGRVVVVSREASVGPPTASLRGGTGVPWVSLLGPTSVLTDAQAGWHREQSANRVRAVSASPVVLSQTSNVFVSLSKPIVILVFCDMLEYLHPCSTRSAALRAHSRFQLSYS